MMEKIPTQSGTRDQLMSDLKSVIADAEGWLRNSSLTGEDLRAAKEKFERTLSSAKDNVLYYQGAVVEKTREAAKATDQYVHENPWRSVAIGATIGLLLGVAISRKD
ncbi:DUF883 family protein [Massilia sp. PWRC2]|uniref:DUF883 family protein n=1 Tax=Massilia sp. PWRC2 TaxID=2804626 RepID=UPI003CFB6D8D